ncbi:hypothetical protein DP114_30015 [Brasilonema sennae CENA114]|uniref:CHAT domain-containing protein n=2 Tax=Bromeliae group (in: Brasilonema) TaxID=3398495 RepID=A0A856MPT0_9CYAN|nr:CHAT domain-containing protein [Brasilonema sennae]QDL11571.1 hypothetical protein DP114_30015 [Brasilonema sennae CENA114]
MKMWRIGNWLRNVAIQLREALNLTPQPFSLVGKGENSKPLKKQEEEWKRGLQSLGEEELQEYFQFLEEVLRVTAESEGDAQVVYPLLVENTQYLNLNLAEVLRRWMTNKLAEVETDEAQSFAVDIFNFSNRIQEFPLGDKASNMEIAIAGYEVVSTVFTRQSFPQDWATTQNNLAAAYRNRIHGEKAENLERAIASYTAALEVRTRESFPQQWAMTQNNLATAYSDRIRGEKAENLESAIASYSAALEVRTRESFPQQWAMTQNNLATAYSDRIRGEKAENLESAIASYSAALEVRTRESFPQQWAMTQNNLATAYSDRIRGEKAENLESAIASYSAALEVRTRESFPQQWAMTQNNLATAYSDRIRGEKAENLESAIASYSAALEVRTRESFPQQWAMTQNNLATAYSDRIRGEKAENLESAIASYSAALEVRTRESFPQNHADTAFNFGLAYIDAERFADAYNIFQSAIDAVEFLRGEIVSGDEIKQKHAEEWNSLYRRMVEVCLELGYDDQAVEYIERSKTRNLVEVIASQKRSQPLQELDQKIAEEKRRLETVENPDTTHLNELRQQREELIGQVIPLKHIRFAQIQELVDERTAILQWYIFDDCFRVFIITRNNQQPIIWQSSLQDLEDLQNWKDEYLKTYTTKKPLWRYQLATKLSKLAEILHINDILNLIPSSCQALILVPHRYLHLLPLHALPISGEGESYLLDNFSGGVRYAPSCQLLKLATSGNPSLLPTRKSFPLLNKERDARQGRVRFPLLGNERDARQGRVRFPGEESRSLFAIQDPNENLIYTNIEVKTISHDFQPTTVIEKSNATKQALLQAESFSHAQVVHFSCHGYFDINSPVDSAIALAGCVSVIPADADSGDSTINSNQRYRKLANGNAIDLEKCLTLPDIFNLSLPECRLVTLSACETGLTSPNSTSDEYIGLPSGFLKAGSSSIVSSLWSVDDLATTLLMIRFYDNQDSLPIAQALCEAQCWLRDSTQAEIIQWTQKHSKINEQHKHTILQYLQEWYQPERKPFCKPESWAGFCAIGC